MVDTSDTVDELDSIRSAPIRRVSGGMRRRGGEERAEQIVRVSLYAVTAGGCWSGECLFELLGADAPSASAVLRSDGERSN